MPRGEREDQGLHGGRLQLVRERAHTSGHRSRLGEHGDGLSQAHRERVRQGLRDLLFCALKDGSLAPQGSPPDTEHAFVGEQLR